MEITPQYEVVLEQVSDAYYKLYFQIPLALAIILLSLEMFLERKK